MKSAGELPEHVPLESAPLGIALNVIATERDALTNLEMLYRTNSLAQESIGRAVTQLVKTIKRGGKLIVCGVGKSGKIGRKLEATMNSMAIHSVFLHPTEALHGDLGIIREVCKVAMLGMSRLALMSIPRLTPSY
jgi:D-arabinose 5-phosphate isomerase GutQ